MAVHEGDVGIQEQACATLASCALRKPENCTMIVNSGVVMNVATAMRKHTSSVKFSRQASLLLRNLVARSPELRAAVLDENVEDILRDLVKIRGCGDEAYSALRDLGCKIQLSESMTGKLELNFDPTLKTSNQLESTVAKTASGPFKK